MPEAITQFLSVYANPQNIYLCAAGVILCLLLLRGATALGGLRDFKRINRILRREEGDDILHGIENLRLSRRFSAMWDDYYAAWRAKDTVTLSAYLIYEDKAIPTHLCRNLSRFVAALSLALAGASVVFVPGLKAQTDAFWCFSAGMLAFLLLAEALFTLMEALRARRLTYLTEEFRRLSLRKLPGRGVDFSGRYTMQAADRLLKELHETQAALTQVNARLDRQYRTLLAMKEESSEETDA